MAVTRMANLDRAARLAARRPDCDHSRTRNGESHGHQIKRLGPDAPSAEGIIYRRPVAGPDHRAAGPGARPRGTRKLRARCAHRMAYPSARAAPACHLRPRTCTG